MKEDQGIPVPEEVQEVLRREQTQAKGLTLADFSTQGVLLRVNKLLVFYGNDGWHCSCAVWQEHQSCRHVMALAILIPSFPSLDLKDLKEGFKKEEQGNAD